jgi:phosphatidylglycerophosphatase A
MLPAAWLGPGVCLALAALAFTVGFWAVQAVQREPGQPAGDPPWVVVDEAAGMLLALAAVPADAAAPWHAAWVLAAFALFRLFDIAKPGPVGWADRRAGPLWVMLDDVLAGALAAGTLLLLHLATGETG